MTQDRPKLSRLHWNYFVALDRELEGVSRYVEFSHANYRTYSVELARLLFAAASEVDVIAKALCALVAPSEQPQDMDEYRSVLVPIVPTLLDMQAVIPRYELTFVPWTEWRNNRNPDWWTKYNNVKHQRDRLFHEGNLRNALNAMSGLLTLRFQFYRLTLADSDGRLPSTKQTTDLLEPRPSLLLLPSDHYYDNLVAGYDNEPPQYFPGRTPDQQSC